MLMRSVACCFLPASQKGVTPIVRFRIRGSRQKNTFPTLQASLNAALDCDNVTPTEGGERNTFASRRAAKSQSQSVRRATPAPLPSASDAVRDDAESSKPLRLLEEALAAHHGRLDARTVAALMKQVRPNCRNPNFAHIKRLQSGHTHGAGQKPQCLNPYFRLPQLTRSEAYELDVCQENEARDESSSIAHVCFQTGGTMP